MTALPSSDVIRHHVPAGFLFADASDLATVSAGLSVLLIDRRNRRNRFLLSPVNSGHWVSHRIEGLAIEVADDPENWPANLGLYEVHVVDNLRRFERCRFEAELPVSGRVIWGAWAGLNQARVRNLLKEGQDTPDYIPLFSRSGRTYPMPRARVRAHLTIRQDDGSDVAAAWAVLRIRSSNRTVGLGIADANGNVEVGFSYPDLPQMTAPEAVAGRSNVIWPIRISVHYSGVPTPPQYSAESFPHEFVDQPVPPLLSDIMSQLNDPGTTAIRRLGQPGALNNVDMAMGEPLVLRTLRNPNEYFSSLYIAAN
ncbi:hypothetical protein [Parasphingorhabdus sp.]|uniref:hypothetical protein n=1 Tax=Parasphingorhabdus sp. TaxID=2709688 RepID=UPI003C73EA81